MRRNLWKWLSLAASAAVACGDEGDTKDTSMDYAEYAAPWAQYRLTGTVVDAQTAAPIPGVEVGFQWETTTTDAQGAWSMDVGADPCGSACEVTGTDVDGAENGEYQPATVAIAPTEVDPGEGWNEGTYEQADIEIALEPTGR